MPRYRIIEPAGFIVAGIALIFSFFFFTNDNAEPQGSFFAAFLTAGLVWISYVLIRWVVLAIKD